ncbi:MAG: helix-turn-helix domain-containing protein [Candidatus Nanoarchaeia archaeon]
MDYETLFTSAKWDVLKALSASKKSPIELAEYANTSVSNISQSLRFLELAGIVKSERIGNRDKGQPRVVYSLSAESAYIILTAKNLVNKKTIKIDEHKKMLLNIWFYDDDSMHPFLEAALPQIEENLEDIEGVFLDKASLMDIKIMIISREKSGKKEFKELTIKKNGAVRKVKFALITRESLARSPNAYYAIYDPHISQVGEE